MGGRGYALVETLVEYRRVKVGKLSQPETADYVGQPHNSGTRIVPDAGFILENEDTGRRALFLVEVDRGTERITTASKAAQAQTITHKMQQYDRYLESDELRAMYGRWGDYAGPVVLFITTTEGRIENMRQALSICNPNLHRRYRFSTLEGVRNNFLHDRWVSRDSEDLNKYQLIRGTPK